MVENRWAIIASITFGSILFNLFLLFRGDTRARDLRVFSAFNIDSEAHPLLPNCKEASRKYVEARNENRWEVRKIGLPALLSDEHETRENVDSLWVVPRRTPVGAAARTSPKFRQILRNLAARLSEVSQMPLDPCSTTAAVISLKRNLLDPLSLVHSGLSGIVSSCSKHFRLMFPADGAVIQCANDSEAHYAILGPRFEFSTRPLKQCDMKTCFDATRWACQQFVERGSRIPAFVYRSRNSGSPRMRPIDILFDRSSRVQFVTDPARACVFVVPPSEIPISGNMSSLAHWNSVDGGPGRNHLLVWPSCGASSCDAQFPAGKFESIGDAIIVSPNFNRLLYRPRFDLPVPISWTRSMENLSATVGSENRSVLVSFLGSFTHLNRWTIDRAIVATLPQSSEDVIFQLHLKECSPECNIKEPIGGGPATNMSYEKVLRASHYGFAPGGSGPYSYRLYEIIAAHSVPVVREDMVLAWEDFEFANAGAAMKSCVLRIGDLEVVDLPEFLRTVENPSSSLYQSRLRSCTHLWNELFLGGGSFSGTSYHEATTNILWDEISLRIKALSDSQVNEKFNA